MKFLVIRLSSIGDIVLTSPVVRCLAQQSAGEIHVLTKTAFTSLYSSNPHVSKVHAYEPEQLPRLIEDLQSEKFDHIIDLQKSRRSISLRSRLAVSATSFPKANLQKWLKVNLKWDLLPEAHVVDRYFEAVKTLGVDYDGQGLDLYIEEKHEQILGQHNISQPFIALAIGAAHTTKRLPYESLVTLCDLIKQPIVLLGGPAEVETGKKLQDLIPHVTSLCGACTLQESAAILQGASLVLTHDTGMMHMAAALQKPIFSIWGNTVPRFGMAPFYANDPSVPQQIFEVAGLNCRPCSKIGHERCPKGHFRCMLNHDLAEIARSAQQHMSTLDSI